MSNFENRHYCSRVQMTHTNGQCRSALGCMIISYIIGMVQYFLKFFLLIMNGKITECTIVLYKAGRQYRYWLTWFDMISCFPHHPTTSANLTEKSWTTVGVSWVFPTLFCPAHYQQQNSQRTMLLPCITKRSLVGSGNKVLSFQF